MTYYHSLPFPNTFEAALYFLKRYPLQRWWHCHSYNEAPEEWGFVIEDITFTFLDREGRALCALYQIIREKRCYDASGGIDYEQDRAAQEEG